MMSRRITAMKNTPITIHTMAALGMRREGGEGAGDGEGGEGVEEVGIKSPDPDICRYIYGNHGNG